MEEVNVHSWNNNPNHQNDSNNESIKLPGKYLGKKKTARTRDIEWFGIGQWLW